MSVKIRLSISGKHNSRMFRIVAIDSKKANNGKFLDQLGFFDPKNDKLSIDKENFTKWVNNGAIVTEAVKNLLRRNK